MVDELERQRETTGLDARTFGLVKVAALIGSDAASPTSYAWHMANALAGGATPDDIVGTLRAVTPQIGNPKAIAATEAIIRALDLEETLRTALLDLDQKEMES
jgi:alkylhydroperoxidase/carboxymuconolactone decarboxylase family protein YurZ